MDAVNGTPERAEMVAPDMGANAPDLGADGIDWGAAQALFGQVRLRVLSLLYTTGDRLELVTQRGEVLVFAQAE